MTLRIDLDSPEVCSQFTIVLPLSLKLHLSDNFCHNQNGNKTHEGVVPETKSGCEVIKPSFFLYEALGIEVPTISSNFSILMRCRFVCTS